MPAPGDELSPLNGELPARDLAAGVPVSLDLKERLTALTNRIGDGLSEYCFSNLYLFRNVHGYRFFDGALPYLTGRTYDGENIVMPLFDLAAVPITELRVIMTGSTSFFPVSEAAYGKLDCRSFQQTMRDADSDYLFNAEDLALLSGNLRRKKRNQAKQVLRTRPSVEVRAFAPADVAAGEDILAGWLSDVGRDIHATDYFNCAEALQSFARLPLFGLICLTGDGHPLGFVLASQVWHNVCSIHFAKARREPPGISALMFSRFAKSVGVKFPIINFEQDLGKPNFRAAKRAYDPCCLLKKHRVWLS